MIECGLYELDITPPLGYPIPGYFTPRPAAGIRDSLYAKAMVIAAGGRVTAILALDAIGIEREEVLAIRQRVTEETGIPADHLIVAATHTHTGGPVYRDQGLEATEYTAFLVKKAVDAVVCAYRGKRPVRLGFAKGAEAGISFNRRYWMRDGSLRTNPGFGNPDIARPSGPIDPDVYVLRIDAEDGTPLGLVTNFACHPDTYGDKRYSADYPGELSQLLKAVYGGPFVSMFLNGACGNINHLDFIGSTKPIPHAARTMGRILAGEAIKLREKALLREDLTVEGRSMMLPVTVRQPTRDDLARAEAMVRKAEGMADASSVAEADLFFARQLLTLRDRREAETEVELQVLRIGDWAVAAFPCEWFVEFGLELKMRSPSDATMIATYANAVNGYVATREAFTQGGYETRLTSRTRLAPDTGERMLEAALKLLGSLFHREGETEI